MAIKDFFKRWAKGIRESTPVQMLGTKRIGHYGAIIGIVFAYAFMVAAGLWYMFILFSAMILLQGVEIVGVNKQLFQAKALEKQLAGGNNGRFDNN